jgi:plastocyanin
MPRLRARLPVLIVSAIAWHALSSPVSAQTCITPNCAFGTTPTVCLNRAVPRTPTVQMGSGITNIFIPANPKIEPGDCIIWRAASSTHSSSGNLCPTSTLCNSPAPPACQWETANVSSVSATPTATCFYDPADFPAASADLYYCRIHATPTTGSMRGTLQITTPIQLTVGKDLATSSVKLNWTGGGVTGDLSYKVSRQNGGDPKFLTATTVNPDGGVLGTTFTEAGDLGNPTTRYYLVRNKQTNEP